MPGLAGMPLVTGLYAAFLPALLAVMFGSSTRLSVGPAALTCVLIAASLNGLAEPGSAQWVNLAVWLALMSGLIQLALGAGGLGWVLNLVSSPVLTGFTQAAALLIIASQFPTFLGLQGSLESLLDRPKFDFFAMGFGALSLASLILGKQLFAAPADGAACGRPCSCCELVELLSRPVGGPSLVPCPSAYPRCICQNLPAGRPLLRYLCRPRSLL